MGEHDSGQMEPDSSGRHQRQLAPAVFLYDGECGFCDRTVQFLLRCTDSESLSFATLQSEFAQKALRERGVLDVDLRVAYLIAGADVDGASSAVLAAMRRARGPIRHLALLRFIPRWIRDRVYGVVARNRKRLMPPVSCPVPSPEERRRFVG